MTGSIYFVLNNCVSLITTNQTVGPIWSDRSHCSVKKIKILSQISFLTSNHWTVTRLWAEISIHRFFVFRIKHYAGSVTYCASGFLAKNTDFLDRDLCSVMFSAHHPLLRTLFPEGNYRPCRYSLLLAKHIIKARLVQTGFVNEND